MVLVKLFTAVALLAAIPASLACSCIAVYFTPCDYVDGLASSDLSVVVRATALSRSPQGDINDDVTYAIDVTAVFKGDIGGESEISFVTPGNDGLCGVTLEIGEEYVLALSPAIDYPFLQSTYPEGELVVGACGLYRVYDTLPDDERIDLEAGCPVEDPCLGSCDEYQECVQYERTGKYYCSDTCDNYPCASGEQCSTRPRKWCRRSGFEGCPERRSCSS